MKAFKDLGIQPESKAFTGDKVKVDKVLNREISVHDFKIENSKFEGKGNGKCLHLAIKIGDTDHVLFTGSGVLMDMIGRVPREAFPFTTTIVKNSDRLEFT